MEIGLRHGLDEEPGDPEADRDGCRALAPGRPLPDVAGGEADRFLPGTCHMELAAGPAPEMVPTLSRKDVDELPAARRRGPDNF